METIKERIMENLKESLEGIKQLDGFNFDFTPDTVQRWSMHGNSMVDFPMVIIISGEEIEESVPDNFEECNLSVYLDIFFIHNEDDVVSTDTYLNRLQGDIKKAILEDYSRGGLAIDTNVLGTVPFEATEGQNYSGIIIEIEIRYRHLRNDPTLK